MFVNKSDLLKQINTIIKKTPFKENHWNLDFPLIQDSMKNVTNTDSKTYSPLLKKTEIKKVEDRLKKLEEQNDQLISIVHFLFQKFTDLVNSLWAPDQNEEDQLNCRMCETIKTKTAGNFPTVAKNDKPSLTRREKDIFNLLAKGLCAKEIAKTLFISETTVITHKRNLKEKFNAKNTVELISNVMTRL